MAKRNKKNNYFKSNDNNNNKSIAVSPNKLTEEETKQWVSNYASSLQSDIERAERLSKISASNGSYQPILSEQILQQTNFNPRSASSSEIERWLLNPQSHDMQLRGLSQYLENAVGQYQRAVHYFTDTLSFNYMMLPTNVDNSDKVDKDSYKKSYYKSCQFVGKMNVKNKFNGMALTTMQDGVSFWWIIENSNHISFLQIPTDYCRIVAPWALGWMGEINLAFFDRMYGLSGSIPELYDAYQIFLQKREEGLRGDKLAPFQYYPLPLDKSWIFTFDPNKATKVPPLASSFGASLDVLSYRNLLKDQSLLNLWKVISMKIPLKKNTDNLLMSYETASDIVGMIQSTLPENMAIFASPFEAEAINTNQINTLDKTIQLSNDNFYTSLGTNGAFFGMETKSSKALDISKDKDFIFSATPLYAQFNNMVNWQLMLNNNKNDYGWKVEFSGNKLNKDSDINTALKLFTTANFPASYLASVIGFEPAQLDAMVNLDNMLGTKDKMKPLTSQFNASKSSLNSGGKEKMELGDLSDSGEAVRDTRGVV